MFGVVIIVSLIIVALLKYIFSSWQFNQYDERNMELHWRHLTELNEKSLQDFNRNIDIKRKEFEHLLDNILKEKQMGYPSLAAKFAEAKEYLFNKEALFLETKAHPSLKSAEKLRKYAKEVKIESQRRKIAEYTLEFYEELYPHLRDLKHEIDPIAENITGYDPDEKEDLSTFFLSKDEYRKLSVAERNQLALDRYFKRKLSNWDIGKQYERYIGYNYEIKGYDVEYKGILDNFEDRGIDLVCKKANEVILIQCKYWSVSKNIFEKHIFQFYGTCFLYEYNDKVKGICDKKYKRVFYTKTTLSDFAKYSAKELGIIIRENVMMPDFYPCIKCNVSKDKKRIYHLPFDQQYDRIKVDISKGECFCKTVQEAEDKGFRRAMRHFY